MTTPQSQQARTRGTPASAAASTSFSAWAPDAERMSKLFDENDHKRCSEGNQKALFAETIEKLRGLTKEIAADDWMFRGSKENDRPFQEFDSDFVAPKGKPAKK